MFWQIFLLIFSSLLWNNFAVPFYANSSQSNFLIEKREERHLPIRQSGVEDIEIAAKALAVLDANNNIFLLEKSSGDKMPIASISKLMTALVFLDHNPGWDVVHEMARADRLDGGKIYLYLGEKVTINDLFNAMLVGSDNTAALALVNSSGLSEDDFVAKMNEYAKNFGLLNTSFSDPSGLSANNISTAREVAQLAKIALAKEEIRRVIINDSFEFKTVDGVAKKIASTNYLLDSFSMPDVKIIGGKTGHTDLAGYCLVSAFTDNNNHNIISVVLGTDSEKERFNQTNKLVNWIYNNFSW